MAWLCPDCGSSNKDSLVRCECGHEMSVENQEKYIFISEEQRHEELSQAMPRQSRELAIEFRGSAREYFRTWIVNLCLTLLTLGIFSAWAKVRKKRYFYSHTTIDGTPFQYLGQPIPILKGRVIAAIAFSAYYASSHYFISMLPYVLVAGTILAPWVIVRSVAFNARYSAFRNMTFRFEGKYLDALKVIYAAVLFAIFVFSFPWWIRRFKNFIISHASYGGKKGEFSATGRQFFKVYFNAGLIVVAVWILTAILSDVTFSFMKKSQVMFLLTAIPPYIGSVFAYAYVQAHSSNLVWNNIRLGPLRFQSTLLARGMTKLYLTNTLTIIASLGLLTPWAVMRTLKYRADNLRVVQEGDLTDFEGGEASAVQAAGAEFGDFFEVDLSL